MAHDRYSPRLPEARWWGRWAASIVAVFAAFAVVAVLLLTTGLQELDEAGFRAINSLGAGPGLLFDVFDPQQQNYAGLVVFALAVTAFTRPRRIPIVAGMLALVALIVTVELKGFRLIWERPRPEEVLDPDTLLYMWASVESFPSGHMLVTSALAGVTALTFPRLRWLMWSYVFVVALSRVLFGAHFPIDVIAGTIIGYAGARATFALALKTELLDGPRGAYERWLDGEAVRVPQVPEPRPGDEAADDVAAVR